MWSALAQEKADRALQLGGDLLFGRRLADRAGVPLLCYAYCFKKGMKHAKVFTAYHSMAENINAKLASPAQVIGDLVKDSLSLETGKETAAIPNGSDSPHVLLFPGSRPAIRNLSLKWFAKITRHVKARIPDIRFTAMFAPFVPENEVSVWESAGLNPVKNVSGTLMKNADYAITQPGTNTLEMMHYGLPALVALPFAFLNVAPVSGLAKFISRVPFAGTAIKKWKLRQHMEQNNGFVSWPNRIAGREILDEAVGELNPYDLAERLMTAINDKEKLSRVRRELLELSGESGAAARLCDAVENTV